MFTNRNSDIFQEKKINCYQEVIFKGFFFNRDVDNTKKIEKLWLALNADRNQEINKQKRIKMRER